MKLILFGIVCVLVYNAVRLSKEILDLGDIGTIAKIAIGVPFVGAILFFCYQILFSIFTQ